MMPDAETYRELLTWVVPPMVIVIAWFLLRGCYRQVRWSRAATLDRDPLIRRSRPLMPPTARGLDPKELAIARSVEAQGPLIIAGLYVSPEVEGWNVAIGECRRRGNLEPLRLEVGLSDDEVDKLLADSGLRLMEQGPTANAIFASYLWFLQ